MPPGLTMPFPSDHAPALRPTTWAASPAMPDVDRLQASIAERLRGAGVALPEARIAPLADAVLADAVQLALAWLEPENGPYWRPDHPPMEGTA